MSILSSNLSSKRFYGTNCCVDILEYEDYVEASFYPAICAGTTIPTPDPSLYVNNGAYGGINNGNIAWGDNITYATTNTLSINNLSINNSCYTTVGFKLKLEDGILRCIRKEISQLNLISTSCFVDAANCTIERECNLNGLSYSLNDFDLLNYIQNKTIDMAARVGVIVPDKFKCGSANFAPALDWLAYPLIREIDSVTLAKNLLPNDRELIAPNYKGLGLKDLVEYHFGHHTGKMLEEIWKVVTVGEEYFQTIFESPEVKASFLQVRDQHGLSGIIEVTDTRAIQYGNRRLNILVFTLCPAVYKVMGFDYLYQLLPMLKSENGAILGAKPLWSAGLDAAFQEYLDTLLKFLSPQKTIALLSGLVDWSNFHLLQDVVSMIEEYSDVQKIPKSLRERFPNGLAIDFKFKAIKEMHDKISTQYTILKAEASKKEIPVHPIYATLDGRQEGGLKLVVPTNTTFLALWGNKLSICIASYGDRAANSDTLLLGVEKEGEIKYCIELGAWITTLPHPAPNGVFTFEDALPPEATEVEYERIALPRLDRMGVRPGEEESSPYSVHVVQFKADHNSAPDPDDKAIVEKLLAQWLKENVDELIKLGVTAQVRDNYNYVNGACGHLVGDIQARAGNDLHINGAVGGQVLVADGGVAQWQDICIAQGGVGGNGGNGGNGAVGNYNYVVQNVGCID